MAKTARIELKVEPEFKERLEIKAVEEFRSVNNLIEVVLTEYLDKEDALKNK